MSLGKFSPIRQFRAFQGEYSLSAIKIPEKAPRKPPFNCTGETLVPHHVFPVAISTGIPLIPRNLFYTVKSRRLRQATCQNIANAIILNPEYHVFIYDDEEVDQLVSQQFNDSLSFALFNAVGIGAMRADIWRYLVVYKFGGVYLDIDSELLKPLKEIIPLGVSMVSTSMPDSLASQWALMYAKSHPILKLAIGISLSNLKNCLCDKESCKYEFKAKKFLTGPPVLDTAFKHFIQVNTHQTPLSRLPLLLHPSQSFDNRIRTNIGRIKAESAKLTIH